MEKENFEHIDSNTGKNVLPINVSSNHKKPNLEINEDDIPGANDVITGITDYINNLL